ncbi:hypothetical protein DFJ67_8250 [Asanoa ferruginea]|uniref:Mce-associated membrane protein n=1 Tax=Asanoa ferruginea TaxID=53367 RepID=A0A3D9ZY97_9ACTN|nr:hypothetical protein [Asanoa ferruginea]REG02158.1 hypothetical protein DFJ67_8250 [Asanoa ferruginea]GIF48545.1 hypothetical protein Afe04nite_30840 [Asanoa ferruginea]
MLFRRRALAVAALTVALVAPLGGCSIADKIVGEDPKPIDESPQKAREKVEAYLAAMTKRDAAAGRKQLCPTLAGTFDKTASGVDGDFYKKTKVSGAVVTDVRAEATGQKVTTAMLVTFSGKKPVPLGVSFLVTNIDTGWCIAGEDPAVVLPSMPSTTSPTPSQ